MIAQWYAGRASVWFSPGRYREVPGVICVMATNNSYARKLIGAHAAQIANTGSLKARTTDVKKIENMPTQYTAAPWLARYFAGSDIKEFN